MRGNFLFVVRSLSVTFFVLALYSIGSAVEKPDHEFPKEAGEILTLQAQVTDADGNPIEGVKVKPWALRCSQGHGGWRKSGFGHSEPPLLETNVNGRVEVPYPRFTFPEERVRTTQVTLSLDHPDYNYVSYEDVDVPLEEPIHSAKLEKGISLEVEPYIDGELADHQNIYAFWSDGRSWGSNSELIWTADGALRIPSMPVGKAQVLLVQLEGERATHFSSILEVELAEEMIGKILRRKVELQPAMQLRGVLSNDVPRPVQGGRVKFRTLPPKWWRHNVEWFTWVPIAADGTFRVDGWPSDEGAQIIALCEGYIAKSGKAPSVIENPRDPDPFLRPQVFSKEELSKPVTLAMTPMVACEIETLNEERLPLDGVSLHSCPNIGWWNGGSQIYCTPLVRGEKMIMERSFFQSIDEDLHTPFRGVSDTRGMVRMYLPAGKEDLYIEHEDYELPVLVGRRRQEIELVSGQPTKVQLKLQRKGSDYLGDWDKLSGILFGCTGPQCRKLLDDPLFVEKMTEVRRKLDSGSDPNDPVLLEEAYTNIAEAFKLLGDHEEADVWEGKAADQAAKQN